MFEIATEYTIVQAIKETSIVTNAYSFSQIASPSQIKPKLDMLRSCERFLEKLK